MKRTEMVKKIEDLMSDLLINGYSMEAVANAVLRKEEELGMLPPTQTCKLVEDTVRGGLKHGPCQREWDEE